MRGIRHRERRGGIAMAIAAAALASGCLTAPTPGDGDDDPTPVARCDGFAPIEGAGSHRYLIEETPTRWLDAVVACAQRDGFLAIVDRGAERSAIAAMEIELWVGTEDIDYDDE